MLGFATVDLSLRDHCLTVWLTSAGAGTGVGHTNAVSFDLAEEAVDRRAWSMACDRYVVVTDRTPRDHAVILGWDLKPCDLAQLRKQTIAAHEVIMAAFTEQAAKPGKADLMEPTLPPVPPVVDQAVLEAGSPLQLTLATANQVMRIWAAWMEGERERVKRWTYMPGGFKGEALAVLPAEFIRQNAVQPVRAWLQ